MPSSQAVGSAGELVAQTRLLLRDWLVGNVNTGGMKNAPAIDLLAVKSNHSRRLAVKATGHSSSDVQWNAPYGWSTLFKGDTRPDFVVFVWFDDKSNLDSCRVFVVPAKIVDRDVRKTHEHWHARPRRDGSPHKKGGHISISWKGNDTAGNISRDFKTKWSRYEDNWAQLER
jgi:hypothetical protein